MQKTMEAVAYLIVREFIVAKMVASYFSLFRVDALGDLDVSCSHDGAVRARNSWPSSGRSSNTWWRVWICRRRPSKSTSIIFGRSAERSSGIRTKPLL
jgi:hypothetical protein